MTNEIEKFDPESDYDLFCRIKVCHLRYSGSDQPYVVYEPSWCIPDRDIEETLKKVFECNNSRKSTIYLANNCNEKVHFDNLYLVGNIERIYIRNFGPIVTSEPNVFSRIKSFFLKWRS